MMLPLVLPGPYTKLLLPELLVSALLMMLGSESRLLVLKELPLGPKPKLLLMLLQLRVLVAKSLPLGPYMRLPSSMLRLLNAEPVVALGASARLLVPVLSRLLWLLGGPCICCGFIVRVTSL